MRILFTGLPVLLLSGCATITRGTKEAVKIDVEPKNAIVTTSLGHKCKSQPCEFKISRKEAFTVTAKADGYKEETVHVKTGIGKSGAAGLGGNILLGGLVGIGVDALTKAANEHSPNPVVIRMVPEELSEESGSRAEEEKKTQPVS